jgi:hypothetical protein
MNNVLVRAIRVESENPDCPVTTYTRIVKTRSRIYPSNAHKKKIYYCDANTLVLLRLI